MSPIKLELQSVKAELVRDNAAIDAKLAKLTGTMGDMEEALTGCTDDMADMITVVERLTAKVAMLRTNVKTWNQDRDAIT